MGKYKYSDEEQRMNNVLKYQDEQLQELLSDSKNQRNETDAEIEVLENKLKQLGIAPLEIEGYDREMNTHMAVAAAVASDSGDAALGVYSAAKALGLDFIEVAKEEYDFAIPVRFLECDQIKRFLEILTSEEFRQELDRLGGYGYARIGEIIRIGE